MIKCEICNEIFKNNLGGDLTRHVKNTHNMTMADNYVKIELNGVEPKCKWWWCSERPNFYRRKFTEYAIGHHKFEWRKLKYIELYGQPHCQNPNCNQLVSFHRGNPRKYCSQKCSGLTEPSRWNQDKVKQTVKDKYGVNNVFQLENIKKKAKQSMMNKYGVEHFLQSEKFLQIRRENLLRTYGVDSPTKLDSVKEKIKITLLKNHGVSHYSKTQNFKEIASKNMCNYNDNLTKNHKLQKYKDTDLYFQSKYEYRFLEICETKNILHKLRNAPRFNLPNGKWHIPDFIFNEKYVVEIKSTYWLNRQGGMDVIKLKKESVESMGYEYILILDENNKYFFDVIV